MSEHDDHGFCKAQLKLGPVCLDYNGVPRLEKVREAPTPSTFNPTNRTHPLQFVVRKIRERVDPSWRLTFSLKIMRNDFDTEGKYGILPHDPKDFFRFQVEDLDKPDFAKLFIEAAYDQGTDLALVSEVRVHQNDKTWLMHIPFIDFACKPFIDGKPTEPVLAYFKSHMDEFFGFHREDEGNWVFFESGHSFHGYGCFLVSEEQYLDHLARLLLLNRAEEPPLVDSRWVGHVLGHRRAGLRLTANNRYYIQVPILIKNPFATE